MPALPLTLAAIRQPAFLYDADGRIAEANQEAEALAGRPLAGCSLADAIGIFDLRHPDGTALAPSDLPACRVLAGGVAVDIPFRVTASDGLTLHVLATASPLGAGDRIVGALSSGRTSPSSRRPGQRGDGGHRSWRNRRCSGRRPRRSPWSGTNSRSSAGSLKRSLAPCRTGSPSGTGTNGSSGQTSGSRRNADGAPGGLVGRSWRELGAILAVAGLWRTPCSR